MSELTAVGAFRGECVTLMPMSAIEVERSGSSDSELD
jgi:hypothetical protein